MAVNIFRMVLTQEDLEAIGHLIDQKLDKKLNQRFREQELFMMEHFVTKEEFQIVGEIKADVEDLKDKLHGLQSDMVDVKADIAMVKDLIMPEVKHHGRDIALIKQKLNMS